MNSLNLNKKFFTNGDKRNKLLAFFIWVLLACMSPWVLADPQFGYRYHYISFADGLLPVGFAQFSPAAVDNSGTVYGTVYDSSYSPHIAIYKNGTVKILQPGQIVISGAVNQHGTIGGAVINQETGDFQAALFQENRKKIIPFLPGETRSFITSVNDSGSYLVYSEAPGIYVQRLYDKRGKLLFTCPDCIVDGHGLNNQGMLTGVAWDPTLLVNRAIRYEPPYDESQLLDSLPSDSDSYAWGINNSGNIVGISYTFGDWTKMHYGIWDRKGNFKTYYEGINYLPLINDKNLLVLSGNFDTDFNIYLLPRPGSLHNIKDLVDNPSDLPAAFAEVLDLNIRGDMIGYPACFFSDTTCPPFFLLQRMGREVPRP